MNGIEKSTKQLTVMPLVVRLLQEVYNAFDESIERKNLPITETNERTQALKKDLNELDNEEKSPQQQQIVGELRKEPKGLSMMKKFKK